MYYNILRFTTRFGLNFRLHIVIAILPTKQETVIFLYGYQIDGLEASHSYFW